MNHQSGGVVDPRSKYFTELLQERRSAEIRKSAAWLSMQRILKRTGSRFVVRGAEGKLANGVFDFEVVRHLYLLQLASREIKTAAGSSKSAVIGDFQTEIFATTRLPTSHVIVPDMIRRKVYAFQQSNHFYDIASENDQEFSGGLYGVMKCALGSRISADEMISQLPITRDDIKLVIMPNIVSYGVIGKSKAFTLVLLKLECQRLGFDIEGAVIDRCIQNINTTNMLNKLGNSLYFTFLYRDDNDLFVDFIQGFISSSNRIKHINDFVSNVHETYLFTANKRAYLRRNSNVGS